eukprot:1833215-Amphidinium_carterae.1
MEALISKDGLSQNIQSVAASGSWSFDCPTNTLHLLCSLGPVCYGTDQRCVRHVVKYSTTASTQLKMLPSQPLRVAIPQHIEVSKKGQIESKLSFTKPSTPMLTPSYSCCSF